MTSKNYFLLAAAAALHGSSTLLGQNYLLTTIGGSPLTAADFTPGAPVGDGGPYWDAVFQVAWRLTMDRAGNIYVADRTGHRIRRIGTDGIVTTVAGTGVAGYSGDGGPAVAAQLNEPAGVAFDGQGNLYISDSLNARIRKVDLKGIITTFAGTGTPGYSGDGGPVASARLSIPYNLYFDAQGNLFFIDDQRVRKITPSGTISLFAGNGVNLGCCLPEMVPDGDGGPAIDALLHQPSGIAFDAHGNVLIAEVYGLRIRRVDSGGVISTFANICVPEGLTFDPAGNLYTGGSLLINGYCYGSVVKIAPDGTQTAIAGDASNPDPVCGDPLGDDGPAQFGAGGDDVFWDSTHGRLVLADNAYVRTLSPANIFPAWVVDQATGCRSYPSPGELVSIRWLGMGPQGATAAVPGPDGAYPTQLAGTTVNFDGIAAPILYVDQTEVRTIIPFRTAKQPGTALQVVYQDVSSNAIVLQSHAASPALFTLAGGIGQAAALNRDFSANSTKNPAQKGSVITLYGTGGGALVSGVQDGSIAMSAIPLLGALTATVGGVAAPVEYAEPDEGVRPASSQTKVWCHPGPAMLRTCGGTGFSLWVFFQQALGARLRLQNSPSHQVRKNRLRQTRRKLAPIIPSPKPNQFPDLCLRPSLPLQPRPIQFDAHDLSFVRRRVRVHFNQLRRHRRDIAQLLVQLSSKALERRFALLALAARQNQQRCPAFLAAQQDVPFANQSAGRLCRSLQNRQLQIIGGNEQTSLGRPSRREFFQLDPELLRRNLTLDRRPQTAARSLSLLAADSCTNSSRKCRIPAAATLPNARLASCASAPKTVLRHPRPPSPDAPAPRDPATPRDAFRKAARNPDNSSPSIKTGKTRNARYEKPADADTPPPRSCSAPEVRARSATCAAFKSCVGVSRVSPIADTSPPSPNSPRSN